MAIAPHFGLLRRSAFGALLVGLCLTRTGVQAGAVNWNSDLFQTNLTSAGTDLDDSFVFELGAFDLTGGFTPTAANTIDWATRWRPVQRNFYNIATKVFSGSYEVTSNASPFGTTQVGYIWGHHCSGQSGEWILLTNSTWKWPAVGGMNPPVSWTVANASAPIVGLKNGVGYHMKMAAVGANPLPIISPADWRSLRFTVIDLLNPAISGWNADPDHDGMCNLLEYATGRDPKAATRVWRPVPAWHLSGANRYLKLRIPRCAYSQITLTMEVSCNLQSWLSGVGDVATLTNTSDLLEVRDLTASTAATKRFIRAKLSVP